MRTYGERKNYFHPNCHGDHCTNCHPVGKNMKNRARAGGQKEIEEQVEEQDRLHGEETRDKMTNEEKKLADGWYCQRYPTIMSGLVLRFRRRERLWANEPEINASSDGVCICGAWPIMRDVSELKMLLSLAARCSELIRRNGHDAQFPFLPMSVVADVGTGLEDLK